MTTTTKHAPPEKATLTTPTDREIRVERIFNATRDRVWKAYTEPALLAQWWGRGNKLVIEKFELKDGGEWRFVEHAPGEKAFGFRGHFKEVTPPTRLVQTFGWDGMPGHEMIETAEFEDLGDGRTRMIGTSLFVSKDERDGMLRTGMEGGMNESYAALDRLLASQE